MEEAEFGTELKSMTMIDLKKKFKSKQKIIFFFNKIGKFIYLNRGYYFPTYSCYDFKFLLSYMQGKKKVLLY